MLLSCHSARQRRRCAGCLQRSRKRHGGQKTKRGQKELDLKTIIPHVEYEQAGEQLQFNLVLPCGSGEAPNYNPALLLGYLQQQYNIQPWLCSVLRTKLYTKTTKNFC